MRIHELKTLPMYFKMVVEDRKHFEWRKNDRQFQHGDLLWLREWKGNEYTGDSQLVAVTEIIADGNIGMPEDYVIMEIKKVKLEV